MEEKKNKVRRNEMIHCENCGEDYASTYKRCPFCDEVNRSGGRRADRGGGYSSQNSPLHRVATVVSLIVIVAAICIVVTVVRPLISKGNAKPGETQDPTPTTTVTATPQPTDTAEPEPTDTVEPQPTDTAPVVTPSDVTGITLNREDFTLEKAKDTWPLNPQVTPSGATGTITWTSSNENVATVDENGVVTAVGGGNCTITATSGTATASCIVRVKGAAATSSTTTTTTTPSTGGTLTLSSKGFSITKQYPDDVTLRVTQGGNGSVTWSSSNNNVATVDANGVVKGTGNGQCTITATSGGKTVSIPVYVSKF